MAFKELEITDWQQELNRALNYRRKYGLEDKWAELEAILYNVDPSQRNAGPNIFLSTLDALASSLGVPNPYITVKARKSDFLAKARLLESADNMLIGLMNMQDEVDKMIYSTFLWGRGIAKIGYDSEYGWRAALDVGIHKPVGMSLSQFNLQHQRIEFNNVQPGMPWFKNVLPHDFLVPWGTYDNQDARWNAHRIVRHIEAVRGDHKYDRSVTKKLEPNMSMEDFVRSYQSTMRPYRIGRTERMVSQREDDGQEYVELWEIRDRATQRIMVMATGFEDGWLRNDEDGLQDSGLPFVSMSFTPRARTFWTTSDAFYLRYHQAELSDIALQTGKNRRLAIVRFLYERGAIREAELDNLFSSEVGVGVAVEQGNNIDQAVKVLNVPTPNMQLYGDAQAVRDNAREQVGFSKNQIGEYEAGGRRTAREVNEVAQASGLRLDRRQNEIRKTYVNAFRIINEIVFANWKMPRVVEVVGEDGAPQWMNVTGDDLKGDYNYQLGFSVGGNESLQERRQTALALFAQLSQDPRFDPVALARWLSRAMNDPEFTATFAQGIINGQQQIPQGLGASGGQQPAVGMGPGAAGPQAAPALQPPG